MLSVSAASLTETVCTILFQRVISRLRQALSGDKSELTTLSSRQVNQIAHTSRKLSFPTTNRRPESGCLKIARERGCQAAAREKRIPPTSIQTKTLRSASRTKAPSSVVFLAPVSNRSSTWIACDPIHRLSQLVWIPSVSATASDISRLSALWRGTATLSTPLRW
jgi:hypothetical protein